MRKTILMEEFHLTLHAPRDLPKTEYDGMHRTLASRGFRAQLLRTIRPVLQQHSSLRNVTITVST